MCHENVGDMNVCDMCVSGCVALTWFGDDKRNHSLEGRGREIRGNGLGGKGGGKKGGLGAGRKSERLEGIRECVVYLPGTRSTDSPSALAVTRSTWLKPAQRSAMSLTPWEARVSRQALSNWERGRGEERWRDERKGGVEGEIGRWGGEVR